MKWSGDIGFEKLDLEYTVFAWTVPNIAGLVILSYIPKIPCLPTGIELPSSSFGNKLPQEVYRLAAGTTQGTALLHGLLSLAKP